MLRKNAELNTLIAEAIKTEDVDDLFHYGYMNGIEMEEYWNDDDSDMIGFNVADDTYYFARYTEEQYGR